MKHTLRKAFTMLAAFMMVLGLSATSIKALGSPADEQTGTITISNVNEGQEYEVFRIFNATSNKTDAISYTLNSNWDGFKNETVFQKYFTIDVAGNINVNKDTAGNILYDKDDEEVAKEFAAAALAYQELHNIANDGKATAVKDQTLTFSVPFGYYLVKTTTGTVVSLNTLNNNVAINDKNSVTQIDKELVNNDNNKGVGDVIDFKVTLSKTESKAKNVVVKDKFSSGLTFNDDIKVTINGVEYTPNKTSDDDYTFKITFTEEMLTALQTADAIITYSGTVNQDALETGADLKNTVKFDFGNKTDMGFDEVDITDPVNVTLQKHAENKVNLGGAKFELYHNQTTTTSDNQTTITAVKVPFEQDGTIYTKLAYTSATDDNTTIISSDTGALNLRGLPVGNYTLKEIQAPAGYNVLEKDIVFSVAADGTITLSEDCDGKATVVNKTLKVLNTTGAQLPSTGGMGTTMLYITGGLLVAGAAILLITRKRTQA